MNFLKFYKNKRVLVTGHTGFKGGWLAIWLNMIGAKVIGYSLGPLYENGIFQSSGITSLISDYRADIRDLNKLIDVFEEEQPEIVFHLAAQPLVLESYNNPVETFEINIQGTVNVLEAIRKTKSVKSAVIITTDKCYENKEWIWGYRENDPMGGHDPYSASKGAAELIISSYRNSFFHNNISTGIASARAGNVIGGGDWSKYRLIPDIIKSITNNMDVELRNPNAVRPWQHVLEPLGAYLLLAAKLYQEPSNYSGAWNFGPLTHEIYSVKQVVEKIIENAGKGNWKDFSEHEKLHEANQLILDISKAIQKLKWQPVLSFDECIKLTVEWYMNPEKLNILSLSQKQINFYQEIWKSKNIK